MEQADVIKWYDALDAIIGHWGAWKIQEGLQIARGSGHPDAKWLCLLFEIDATERDDMVRALRTQGDDPRALFLYSWVTEPKLLRAPLRQAAEMGYAPAQAAWGRRFAGETDQFSWLEKAAMQGDRWGLYRLRQCLWNGRGCRQNRTEAVALWKEAAELGHRTAQYDLGKHGYSDKDWQRYHWWGQAAARGHHVAVRNVAFATIGQLHLFEEGNGSGHVVFELGSVLKNNMDVTGGTLFGNQCAERVLVAAQRCCDLYDKWCACAIAAIECWLGLGRRLHIEKDIRVLIARLLWKEPWAWIATENHEVN